MKAAAAVQNGRSVVHLASLQDPVETDTLFAPPCDELTCSDRRLPVWKLAAAAAVGFALAVLAVGTLPAHSTSPQRIVIDCDEPGEIAPAPALPGRKVQS